MMPNSSECSETTTHITTPARTQESIITNTLYMDYSHPRARSSMRASVQQSVFLTLFIVAALCASSAASSPAQQQQQSTIRVQQCREGCFEKFATKETLCQQNPECLTCWDECGKPPPPKISKSIRETWSLHTVSMLQQDSLVLVDVAWAPLGTPNQCLVTWEVSGGGLMGNLLTESFNVQLSLWPDTKYRVQVTCKNKLTGAMTRSMPLTIDTAEAVIPQENTVEQQHQQQPISTTLLPVKPLPTGVFNDIDNSILDAAASSDEQDLAPVLPYEDQSAETINQHTNFIFNWHSKKSDMNAIEPLAKPDLNLLTIAALSDMQKPLLFGVIAGTFLLLLILLLYVCMVRQQRLSNDKAALIEEDVHSVVVSMPPTAASAAATSTLGMGGSATAAHVTRGEVVCQNPAICSRNALKV